MKHEPKWGLTGLDSASIGRRPGPARAPGRCVSKLTVLNLENKGSVPLQSLIQVVRALGLVDELAPLFALQPKSIALMEAADAASRRVRASARRKPAGGL